MKKLYHLFVTRYKLRVKLPRFCFAKSPLQNLKGIYCSGVARNAPTSYLTPITSHLLPHTSYLFLLFCILPFASFAQTAEADVTQVDFSCPAGTITVTYDLDNSVDSVTLYYSPDKCPGSWLKAVTEKNVGPGTDLTITWDAAASGVSYGKFYFKVEYPQSSSCNNKGVEINGICWAETNLDVNRVFCEHPWDLGALYQWGRLADGHEARNSLTSYSSTNNPIPPHSNFICGSANWLNPSNENLWNSGTTPIKTIYDPCPEGWRVPTLDEFDDLYNTIINQNGPLETYLSTTIKGRWFGNDGVPSLFLPGAGYRNYNPCSLQENEYGYYWSSHSSSASSAQILYFNNDNSNKAANQTKACGCSIRCVSEN